MGVSLLWFLLDVAFYGLGLDSPATLHRLWLSQEPAEVVNCTYVSASTTASIAATTLTLGGGATTTILQALITSAATLTEAPTAVETVTSAISTNLPWNSDEGDRCATISGSLKKTAVRTLLISSIASMIGSLMAIVIINYFSRKRLMAVTSGILSVLFFAAGFSVWKATETEHHEVSVVFFSLSQFMFNVGPNTLTFIIAAESFPTVFRGTFHGFAAAAGKIGALLIQPVMDSIGRDKQSLMAVLFGFCGVTLVMSGVSMIPGWILEVQHPRGHDPRGSLAAAESGWRIWIPRRLVNKSLEDIAPNPEGDNGGDRAPTMAIVEDGIVMDEGK